MLQGDRVHETTSVTGTGTATLLGAVANKQSFATKYPAPTTDNLPYGMISQDPANPAWEVGYGRFTLAGTTFMRLIVTDSSNGGALVNFLAGTKDIFITIPASNMNYPEINTVTAITDSVVIAVNYAMSVPYKLTNTGKIYNYGILQIT